MNPTLIKIARAEHIHNTVRRVQFNIVLCHVSEIQCANILCKLPKNHRINVSFTDVQVI